MTFELVVDGRQAGGGAAALGGEAFLHIAFLVELHVASDFGTDGVEDVVDEWVVGVEVAAPGDVRSGGEEVFDVATVAGSDGGGNAAMLFVAEDEPVAAGVRAWEAEALGGWHQVLSLHKSVRDLA